MFYCYIDAVSSGKREKSLKFSKMADRLAWQITSEATRLEEGSSRLAQTVSLVERSKCQQLQQPNYRHLHAPATVGSRLTKDG